MQPAFDDYDSYISGDQMELADAESERRVLSAMLHSEEACIEAYNSLGPLDFYTPLHGTIYELVTSLFEREIRPTYVELLKEGHRLGIFTSTRDAEALKYIAEHYIEDENIKFWIKNVREKSRLRKFEGFLRQNYQTIKERKDADLEELLMKAEEELTNITALEIDDRIDSPDDMAALGFDETEKRFMRYRDNNGVIVLDGLNTGFASLNVKTLGYKAGDLIILGAQTGHGKTSFALHTAKAIAVDDQKNVLYLNTEMSRVQIALRWGSILSGIEHERIRAGAITEVELSRLAYAYSRLKDSGFYSYPCPNLTPEKTVSIARKFKAQKDIDMMIIDYIGRMDKMDPRLSEWQILEQIVKTQKLLAQNLQIAVMCLVQLNPDGTLQGAKRMKNECDLLLKLGPIPREDFEDEKKMLGLYQQAPNYYITIDKNRDGQSGIQLPIIFDMPRQHLRDVVPK